MKTVSKILKITGSAGLMIGLMVVSTVPTHAIADTNLLAVCTRISSLSGTSSAAIETKITAMNTDFATRQAMIASRSTTVDPKIDAARVKVTEAFDTKIATLEKETVLSAAQKTAIATFSDEMHAAEKTRQTTVDAARSSYRTNLTAVVSAHQTSLKSAATTYQTSVKNAFATAESHCGDGTTMSNLKTSVKAARDIFKSARTDTKVTTDIKALMATRDTAVKTADADFAKTAATLTATLSAILNATSSPTKAQ